MAVVAVVFLPDTLSRDDLSAKLGSMGQGFYLPMRIDGQNEKQYKRDQGSEDEDPACGLETHWPLAIT
jgi:hypothetical protein